MILEACCGGQMVDTPLQSYYDAALCSLPELASSFLFAHLLVLQACFYADCIVSHLLTTKDKSQQGHLLARCTYENLVIKKLQPIPSYANNTF